LTAHTFTDDTETILMNIARGTGLNGLGGIPWLRFLENSSIRVLRPMLDIDRDDVRTWMESKGLPWREDPTNADTSILRNRVRLKVIPVLRNELGWDIDQKLAQLAFVADEVTSTGGLWSAENIRSLVREQTELNISRAATTRIQSMEHMETGSRVDIAYGWSAVRERTGFSVVKPESTASAAIDISIPGVYTADGFTLVHTLVPRAGLTIAPSPWIGYFDASRRSSVLLWRQWERGDGIMPFGMDGPVHVSSLLSNAKVSHAARPFVRVVEDDHELLWVCGVRTSESYRVTDKTTVVRILAIIPSADILS
jgi:tRNA(Ile)-lysidine synthase